MGTADGSIVGTTKVIDHGPNGDKWNLVVLGDGFRAADQADYTAAVTSLVNTLKATAPFDGVWDRVNVHRVDVHSTDAGADDPAACADGSSPAGGTAVTAKTYFDSSFCNSGIRRLLVPDQALAVTTANAQVPGWDAILMIVNSTEFGGSGGTLATYSLAPAAIEIAIHEMGHAAFGLADEYEYFTGCASGEAGHNTHREHRADRAEHHRRDGPHEAQVAPSRRRRHRGPDDPERRLHEVRSAGKPRRRGHRRPLRGRAAPMADVLGHLHATARRHHHGPRRRPWPASAAARRAGAGRRARGASGRGRRRAGRAPWSTTSRAPVSAPNSIRIPTSPSAAASSTGSCAACPYASSSDRATSPPARRRSRSVPEPRRRPTRSTGWCERSRRSCRPNRTSSSPGRSFP